MTATASRPIVLVIEDEPLIVRVIEESVSDLPIEMLSAADGISGLRMVKEHMPALVLLDLALPGIDGWEILADIRNTPETESMPVVIVTAHGDTVLEAESRTRGANGFVSKPFRPSDLREIIYRYLPTDMAEAV
ncbi:MAG: response regulator [Acidimicrobiia bacterium]|nr:response regulator [Acidimicrobiia bacterium]MDH3470624.1 response regulator [Acidimicrobiia bacterium]